MWRRRGRGDQKGRGWGPEWTEPGKAWKQPKVLWWGPRGPSPARGLVRSVRRGPVPAFWAIHLLGVTLPPGHRVRSRGDGYEEPRRKSRFNQGSKRAGQARTEFRKA